MAREPLGTLVWTRLEVQAVVCGCAVICLNWRMETSRPGLDEIGAKSTGLQRVPDGFTHAPGTCTHLPNTGNSNTAVGKPSQALLH